MAEKLKVAAIGVTERPTSGVRDYAELLAEALPAEGIVCSLSWLTLSHSSLRAERPVLADWCRRVMDELAAEQPDAVLLHYSPFAYGHRGVPVYVPSVLRATSHARAPLVTIAHELAYPWARRSARERVWAITQRAALAEVVRRSRAVVVTMDSRAQWLRTSRWLVRRRIDVVPVFSNLPEEGRAAAGGVADGVLGLFGYGYDGVQMELVLDGLAQLRRRGRDVRLRLLGAPGPDSERSERWRRAASERGLGEVLEFSGILPAVQLAGELARCELLLAAVDTGPTSRKGTVAASLASGRPVLAIDGPQTWEPLVTEQALELVPARADGIADGAERLLADERLQGELGARGQALARRRLSLPVAARAIAETIRRACAEAPADR